MSKDRSLPLHPVVGDLIRLRPERITEYMTASKLAGYKWDPYLTREVVRVDGFAPGGGDRLFVDGPPFCFLPRDVKIEMTEAQRREMLLGRGWSHYKVKGIWRAPR